MIPSWTALTTDTGQTHTGGAKGRWWAQQHACAQTCALAEATRETDSTRGTRRYRGKGIPARSQRPRVRDWPDADDAERRGVALTFTGIHNTHFAHMDGFVPCFVLHAVTFTAACLLPIR